MIWITPSLSIDETELQFDFIRSAGPGGQNINKVSTAVQLRFDAGQSASLPEDVRQRLVRLAGRRMTVQGVLVIEARQHRTQEANRQAAIERLVELLRQAAEKPRIRRKTKPTLASQRRRLESKRRRGEIKSLRRSSGERE